MEVYKVSHITQHGTSWCIFSNYRDALMSIANAIAKNRRVYKMEHQMYLWNKHEQIVVNPVVVNLVVVHDTVHEVVWGK